LVGARQGDGTLARAFQRQQIALNGGVRDIIAVLAERLLLGQIVARAYVTDVPVDRICQGAGIGQTL
jgi:hypothetical protein